MDYRLVAGMLVVLGLACLGALHPAGSAAGQAVAQAGTVWDSGWTNIATGTATVFTHNLGGDPALYAVDLWQRDTRSDGLGIHHRAYGGMNVAGQRHGVHWQNLMDSTITVVRWPDDVATSQIRLRIWVPDPPLYDSGWVDINPNETLTLPHNLGGDVDDYTVGIKFRDTNPSGRGIHHFGFGGFEAGGVFRGVAWHTLTDSTIQVNRLPGDTSADQVRVLITRPDPPDFDSGWVDVAPGEMQQITHNLGGNPNGYVVRASARALDGEGAGINVIAAGGLEVGGQFQGVNWERLSSTSITVFRRPQDIYADQVRIRIWRPERRVFLPLVARNFPAVPEQELAYDDGTMETTDSWEAGKGFAVRFTPPAGGPVQLVRARYYLLDPRPIEVHVWDANHTDLVTPFTAATNQEGWNDVDLSAYNVTVTGDFYVGFFHLEDYRPTLGVDTTSGDGRSFEVDGGYWEPQAGDYMIRAVVVQR
jgi:hypothetical protein